MSFNKTIIMGNLTRDPELRYTPQGTAVTDMAVAVNDGYGDKKTVIFVDVTAWDKQAESCCGYLKKGSKVLVEGRLTQDEWEDRETGKKRSKMKVTAQFVCFLGGKGEAESGGGSRASGGKSAPPAADSGFEDTDDVPF